MRGACHCGQVVFEVTPPLRDVVACHCSQCRKQSGHYWAATSVPHERFRLVEDAGLRWFSATPAARRGFCGGCGAVLFWEPAGEGRVSLSPAALEGPTGLTIAAHIHQEDSGDYYSPEGPPPAPVQAETLHGSCLCGANRFSLPGPMGEVTACHCGQCRKLSGHYSASFWPETAAVDWAAQQVTEYATSGGGTRGFCSDCGSSLWFRSADGGLSIEAGAIDNPTGGQLVAHIFVAEKGDYYTLDDGLPQSPGRD